jgi:deoxyribodipyrimidine photolyase-related protein
MSEVTLVFPHQLFENHPALDSVRQVYLVEEHLFFAQYAFHRQKLIFHRASMKAYQAFLLQGGYRVQYVDATNPLHDVRELMRHLGQSSITTVHLADVADDWLRQRIGRGAEMAGIRCITYPTPSFMLDLPAVDAFFKGRKKLFQTDFYIAQRKRFNLLLTSEGQPAGGKWTYDTENRKKYPRGRKPPVVVFPAVNDYWKEAGNYVNRHFPDNPGRANAGFVVPTTFQESRAWLNQFLTARFAEFGPYEDALVAEATVLHHSVISPLINAGLLTPAYIVSECVAFADQQHVPLPSLEGFIRQVIGWREFIRGVYEVKGREERQLNFWKFTRRLPQSFWKGSTGMLPVDLTIRKVLDTGYCHHIERLMVLGNFMMLCEFHPDDVYRWFMEMFVDAYDWVMVPNVYGMSQFADGGLMATKPYISGSNYLMKMSDYPAGEWQKDWDALFWRFMDVHRAFFLQNPRLGMLIKTFDKMPEEKKKAHHDRADRFLRQLYTG